MSIETRMSTRCMRMSTRCRMSRLPIDVLEIEHGEDARYSPPAGAERWRAFSRTDILSSLNDEARGSPLITHGGPPRNGRSSAAGTSPRTPSFHHHQRRNRPART